VTAGWYPDPHGGPGLRWWDGSTWTEHTAPQPVATPETPGQPAALSGGYGATPSGGYGGTPSGGYGATPSGGYAEAPPGGGNPSGLLVGGAVAAVVLLVVVAVVLLTGGDGGEGATTDTTSTTTEATETTVAPATTAPPATTPASTPSTITPDPDSPRLAGGGLSFARVGEPWQDWAVSGRGEIPEVRGTVGQFVIVQEVSPSGGQWIANLLLGSLTDDIVYNGEDALAATTQTLAQRLIDNHYVENLQAEVQSEREVTVDGHAGYYMHHELTFRQEGLETTRETLVVVVVDTGQERPGVFWASMPHNRADLNPGLDAAYASLAVDG
jgi:Protein of unknown function (DUF2510)